MLEYLCFLSRSFYILKQIGTVLGFNVYCIHHFQCLNTVSCAKFSLYFYRKRRGYHILSCLSEPCIYCVPCSYIVHINYRITRVFYLVHTTPLNSVCTPCHCSIVLPYCICVWQTARRAAYPISLMHVYGCFFADHRIERSCSMIFRKVRALFPKICWQMCFVKYASLTFSNYCISHLATHFLIAVLYFDKETYIFIVIERYYNTHE